MKLSREFFLRDANTVAPELLGKRLVHRTPDGITEGLIVEVESYIGAYDKGAHSYPRKKTTRTRVQFGPGGYAYVYTIYGLHACLNVVTNRSDEPEAVLIRALEPTDGIEKMAERRGTENLYALCNGPGKLCQAMAIGKAQYGMDLLGDELYLAQGVEIPEDKIWVSPRIHIDYAEECAGYLWRYYIGDSVFVSPAERRYTRQARPYRAVPSCEKASTP